MSIHGLFNFDHFQMMLPPKLLELRIYISTCICYRCTILSGNGKYLRFPVEAYSAGGVSTIHLSRILINNHTQPFFLHGEASERGPISGASGKIPHTTRYL